MRQNLASTSKKKLGRLITNTKRTRGFLLVELRTYLQLEFATVTMAVEGGDDTVPREHSPLGGGSLYSWSPV